jgi:RNA polymerase sigma-70 factor (ECF subfamily)
MLCRRYWFPIYASLRRHGFTAADAEDLTQGFFLHLTERDTVSRANPERGRFRDFLIGVLRWFLAHEHERTQARKRGGGNKFVAIDIHEVESWLPLDNAAAGSFELQFDRQWAQTLVRNALAELQTEYSETGEAQVFVALRPCLDPSAPTPPSYATLAERLARSEGAIKVAVHRLRNRFREVLRSEVAATVADAREIDEELAHLREVLALETAPAS